MRLVVDTNVLLSALIKASSTRSILLDPRHHFYVPEYGIIETEKYFELMSSKSGLSMEELALLFDLVASNLDIIPSRSFSQELPRAEVAMGTIDHKDIPFLALALSLPDCDGIWSNDEHFKRQDLMKVWNTSEIVKLLH